MKNVNQYKLANIEKTVRDSGPEIVIRKSNDPKYSHLSRDQILEDVYGDRYKSAPENFCFRDGDRMLIKELVDHVKKIVDGNGINTGLHHFKIEVKKPRQRRLPKISQKMQQPMVDELKIESVDIENFDNVSGMKSDLLQRVQLNWINHGADKLADIGQLDDNVIHVTIENGRTYGNITCVICRDAKKKKKTDKCRVYFCPIKNNWVMSNFAKHLRDYHQLKSIRGKQTKSKMNSKSPNDNDDDSVCIIEELEVEIVHEEPKEYISIENEIPLLTQLANQTTEMVAAALFNDDQQEKMRFFHDENRTELTVSKILGDGNCLLASIVHQVFRMVINSEEHESATIQLRKDIY